jgi:hypothetical protein
MKHVITGLVCVASLLACCQRQTPGAGGAHNPDAGTAPRVAENTMDTTELISLIRAGYDDRALEAAKAGGPGVYDTIEPLTADPSPEVRAIALRVLDAADRPRARPLAVKALADPTDHVKTFAVAVLRPDPPSDAMPAILSAFHAANDPALRGEIALLAGRVDPPGLVDAWRSAWAGEPEPYAKADVRKALARMGDQTSRQTYAADMKQAKGREAFDMIRGTAYFEDTWPVPHLAALLDRQDVALHLAADYKDTHPFRVCDVALEAILKLTGEPVDFQVPRPTQYKPSEIEAVRAIARKYN